MENIPRIHYIGHPRRDSVNLSSSKEGSSSCQCTTTLKGENKETQKKCETNSVTVANYARRFSLGRWSFLGTWIREDKARDLL